MYSTHPCVPRDGNSANASSTTRYASPRYPNVKLPKSVDLWIAGKLIAIAQRFCLFALYWNLQLVHVE